MNLLENDESVSFCSLGVFYHTSVHFLSFIFLMEVCIKHFNINKPNPGFPPMYNIWSPNARWHEFKIRTWRLNKWPVFCLFSPHPSLVYRRLTERSKMCLVTVFCWILCFISNRVSISTQTNEVLGHIKNCINTWRYITLLISKTLFLF